MCADKIFMVKNHLSTHTPAPLYAPFPPQEARGFVSSVIISILSKTTAG